LDSATAPSAKQTATTAFTFPSSRGVLAPFDRPGFQPAVAACGLFVVLNLITGTIVYLSGIFDPALSPEQWRHHFIEELGVSAILSAGFCYLLAVLIFQRRHYNQALIDLRPSVDFSDDQFKKFVFSRALPSRQFYWRAALGGAAMSALFVFIDPRIFDGFNPWDFSQQGPTAPWHRVLGALMGAAVSVFLSVSIYVSVILGILAKQLKPLNLFDLGNLKPFAEQGTASVLWITGFTAIFASFHLLSSRFFTMILIFAVMNAVICLGALLAPVLGIAQRIQTRKEIELASVQSELDRLGPARSLAQSDRLGRTAELLTYKTFIESVSNYPYDSSTLGRVSLYLLVPLWSWAASALVEKILDISIGWS